MTSYKLVYFDVKGRAELIRLMFAEAGVEFKDERITFEEWPSQKAKMPFGQLPVLYVNDKPLCQSLTIVRYLAREFNLDSDDSVKNAFADALLTTINEVSFKLPFMEKDERKKEELLKKTMEDNITPAYGKIEKKLAEKRTNYLLGDTLCYIDLALLSGFDTICGFDSHFPDNYPALKALVERVSERPNIKKYLESRPKRNF